MVEILKIEIRSIFRRIIFGSASSPKRYSEWLKKLGVEIGEGTIFFDPVNTIVDIQNPKLLKIGRNVRVTSGCKILTHDFSSSVIGGKYGECIGALGTVEIGDNVFLGMNSIILRNTKIGDNVIIGAGSVVSGFVESDSVYAGVPAKKVSSLEDFYQKRKSKVEFEIKNVISKVNTSDETELWRYLREYACFFQDSPEELKKGQMIDTGYYELCKEFYKNYDYPYKIGDFCK